MGPDSGPYLGTATAASTISGFPALQATAVANALQIPAGEFLPGPFYSESSISETYYVELSSALGLLNILPAVPIDIAGLAETAALPLLSNTHDFGTATVGMNIGSVDGSVTLFSLPGNSNGSYSSQIFLPTNVIFAVTLDASALANVTATPLGSVSAGATAAIDPTFTIDPSCDCADDYEFVFSPGITNDSVSSVSVPEPFTVFLFGAGLAGAVALRRRMKKAA